MANYEIIFTAKDRTRGAFGSVEKGLGGVRKFAVPAAAAITGIGVAAAGVGVKLVGAVSKWAKHAAAISRSSRATGVHVEEVSRLEYAFSTLGLELDDVDSVLTELNIKQGDAILGNKSIANAFSRLNIELSELSSLAPDQTLLRVADGLQDIESHAERVNLVDAIFGGDDGRRILPLLEQGRKGIEALAEESDRFGITLSASSAKAAEALRGDFRRIRAAATGVKNHLIQTVTPALATIVETAGRTLGILPSTAESRIADTQGKFIAVLSEAARTGELFGDSLSHPVRVALAQLAKAAGVSVDEILAHFDRVQRRNIEARIEDARNALDIASGYVDVYTKNQGIPRQEAIETAALDAGLDPRELRRYYSNRQLDTSQYIEEIPDALGPPPRATRFHLLNELEHYKEQIQKFYPNAGSIFPNFESLTEEVMRHVLAEMRAVFQIYNPSEYGYDHQAGGLTSFHDPYVIGGGTPSRFANVPPTNDRGPVPVTIVGAAEAMPGEEGGQSFGGGGGIAINGQGLIDASKSDPMRVLIAGFGGLEENTNVERAITLDVDVSGASDSLESVLASVVQKLFNDGAIRIDRAQVSGA